MSIQQLDQSPNKSTTPKRSRATIKLAAIHAKQAALIEQLAAAEAAVSEEKHRALVQQGLNDFLAFLSHREPGEIEGIIAMAIPAQAPVEKMDSVQHWAASLKAAAAARRKQ